jgi:hypothetical protein
MIVIIESISETQTFDSGFQKREFVGVDNSNPDYPQPIKFEVTQQKVDLLDKFGVGEEVDVEFNIRGNRWTNPKGVEVIFNSLQAWKINAAVGTATAEQQQENEGDVLPF